MADSSRSTAREGRIAAHEIQSVAGRARPFPMTTIMRGMALLAETEGILAEPAGGTVIAAVAQLRDNGVIARSDRVVAAVTGNALKTLDAVAAMPGAGESEALPLSAADAVFHEWVGQEAPRRRAAR